ncbi:hypothetical protein RHMOL_Rhmol05G0009900 [Rhododendron molle]|uniref:Uncharacterized protein n=1 Tax=Rhododendron molle TaxID=49168 RepID=A0ACC0NJG8_RHOML|nr:hypothetical protein RHMOL_Rhmol05G0009900 [Rhododendron molle]
MDSSSDKLKKKAAAGTSSSIDPADIALKWVEKYPRLPASPLETMAWKRSAFKSGSQLSFWQRKIYPYVPVKWEKCSVKDQNKRDDVEMSIPQVTSSHVHEDNRAQSIGKNISIFGI